MSQERDDAHLIEDQLSSEQVWQGRLLDVRRDRVRLPDGHEGVREYVVHPGAVVVIGLLDNGRLLFERQFRYPVGQVFLELPAGKIDPGEDILATAQRELLEETGYSAATWRYLGVMHPCIGYSNERIEIFLARGLVRESAPQLDHGEHLEVLEMSLEAALAAIRVGRLTDAKSITALLWAEKVLQAGW
ncbi:MAG TPA: NUDIX hydrolase [Azospira sp.]|nr:NUDIX hydrolase [Azospira sp.]